MDARTVIHRLLYHVFLTIREESVNTNQPLYHIADLLHNVPLQLENVATGNETADEILQWLNERAEQKGAETSTWLRQAISDVHEEFKIIQEWRPDELG